MYKSKILICIKLLILLLHYKFATRKSKHILNKMKDFTSEWISQIK
jgi:hypothetical protein